MTSDPRARRLLEQLRDDRAFTGDPKEPLISFTDLMQHVVISVPLFVIDNVVNYFFTPTGDHTWGPMSFPNIAPPYPVFWMEGRDPNPAPARSEMSLSHGLGIGALFVAYGRDDMEILDSGILAGGRAARDHLEPFAADENTRWVLSALLFQQSPTVGRPPLYLGEIATRVCADGRPWTGPGELSLYCPSWPPELVAGIDRETLITATYYPMLLAISFLHCGNVVVQEAAPGRVYDRTARRRGEARPVRFHTLHIEALQRILRRAQADTPGVFLQQALHICRGHFKNYESSGLFGKHHGLYWWKDQTRGAASRGRVVKGYEISPPRTEERS